MGLQSNRQNGMETAFDNFIELPKKDDNEKNSFLGKKSKPDLQAEEN
ncbi:hypothetical protein G7084_04690 [Weissella coleopterorum]|uniref:Uncharacterized protein n=1 Tax=Weissella coleopterorum TaxID=2714949 RepID=A0A6G8B0C7_9LACO|nr:hypothetical protein [Weissella coleopterorum]QIL50672.1 hypothetical protein G7084_04690 [Weissella coleopterorum]